MLNRYKARNHFPSAAELKGQDQMSWRGLEAAALFLISLSSEVGFSEVDEEFLDNLRSLEEFEWGKEIS